MESAKVLITEKLNSRSWTDQLLRCWKENMNYNLGFPGFSSKILFAHLSSIHPSFLSFKKNVKNLAGIHKIPPENTN